MAIHTVSAPLLLLHTRDLVESAAKQRWLDICAEAAIAIDPDRLKILGLEIQRLLAAEELRLRQFPPLKP
jgi:hypothetical protein